MVTTFIALISVIAFAAYFIILVALHLLPTGYNPIRNAISDYGVGRYRWLSQLDMRINGVGTLALLAALAGGIGAPPLTLAGLMALALIALPRIGMSFFPTDLPGQPRTTPGMIHLVLAVISFAAAIDALIVLTPNFTALAAWHAAHAPVALLAGIAPPLLAVVGISLIPALSRTIFGLTERLFLLTVNLWLGLVAVFLFAMNVGLLKG